MGPNTKDLSSKLPPCSQTKQLEKIDNAYRYLRQPYFDLKKIEKRTKCIRPCSYNVFSLSSEVTQIKTSNSTRAFLAFESNYIVSKKQVWVYPWTSLIAEFGGTLGLFVGFSFIMIWDFAEASVTKILSNVIFKNHFNK